MAGGERCLVPVHAEYRVPDLADGRRGDDTTDAALLEGDDGDELRLLPGVAGERREPRRREGAVQAELCGAGLATDPHLLLGPTGKRGRARAPRRDGVQRVADVVDLRLAQPHRA